MKHVLFILLFPLALSSQTIYLIGDSKTAGDAWHDSLESHGYTKLLPVNAGVGWQTATIRDHIDDSLANVSGTPDYVLINLGINDVHNSVSQADIRSNYDYILDALHTKWSSAVIFVCKVWSRADKASVDDVNLTLDTLVDERSYLRVGHNETVWLEGGDDGYTMTSDGTHYSSVGQLECESQWLSILSAEETGGVNYYIAQDGDDSNNGLTAETPWKHLNRICDGTFSPGDSILFKRGDTLYGEFTKQGVGWVGTAANPIVFATYGTGNKPILYGDCSEGEWTAVAGRDSMYKKFIGYCASTQGFENRGGATKVPMRNRDDETKFYLSTADSLDAYLDSFVSNDSSDYGPCSYANGWDTVYIKTFDGNAPDVTIFRNSTITGKHLIIRDLDFRNYKTAIGPTTIDSSIIRNCDFWDNFYISVFIKSANGGGYNLVDSCTVNRGGYTGIYSWHGNRNIFRHDTVRNIQDTILGCITNIEQAGFGFEQDTACVMEYCYVENCDQGGVDTYFNHQDTLRYNTIIEAGISGGVYLNGSEWVCHDNYISGTNCINVDIGRYTGYDADTIGRTHIYRNILYASGRGLNYTSNGTSYNANGDEGTVLFEDNIVHGSASNTNLCAYEKSLGCSSDYNAFTGIGRFLRNTFAEGYNFESTLQAWKDSTAYDDNSTGIEEYYIQPTVTGSGTLTPDYPVAVNSGSDYVFTSATPVTMTVDSVATDSTTSYTFSNVLRDHTIEVNYTAYAISTTTLDAGTVGVPYSETIAFSSPVSSDCRILIRGLPPGLWLKWDGVIQGTPTTAGTYTPWVRIQARNTRAKQAWKQISITINAE